MTIEPWRERWEKGQTGFHEPAPNALLVAHAGAFEGRRRVLVPLCGKAHDMTFLRERGLDVVGVEGVSQAVEAYFTERGVSPTETSRGGTRWLSHDGVAVAVADYFDVQVDPCDAVYDRGALVAVEPSLRARYVDKTLSLLHRPATLLVVGFAYDQREMAGPPFSLSEADVRALFGPHGEVTLLSTRDALAENPRFRDRGATAIEESVFRIDLA